MRRLVYLSSARRDLQSILDYISRETRSAEIALGVVGRIREKCRSLATLPGTLGRPRPELREDVRSVVCGSHVIVFRYRNDLLEIINIFEGHRDIVAHYHPDEGS
ncbi:MAG: type II toxin-antitoxin system RelE/ParE family toxin [Mesorhizobium sp.]|nr:type II toxin-antitoxin system RelE/ParE family toxin [Mesorhizobium sp.]